MENGSRNADFQPYIIEINKELRDENNVVKNKLVEKDNQLEEITSDNERMEKSITYLRGLVLAEKHLKETIYKLFIDIMRERKHFHDQVKYFISLNNYYMLIISMLWFIAYATYFFTKANFFSAYLFIASVGCLLYFFASPNLTVDATTNRLLNNRIKDTLKDYKKHQENSNYLDELIEKC